VPPAELTREFLDYHAARHELATGVPYPRAVELARRIELFEARHFPALHAEVAELMSDPETARQLRALLGRTPRPG
jgi:hypothetical protein